jgi:hypothetical protein
MPIPKGFKTDAFLQQLDKTRDLCGVRVVYFDGAIMSILRDGPPISQADLLAVVIRKGGKDLLPTSPEVAQARDQRFHAELLNLGLSCGGAALAWVTAWISGAAAPVSGGASLIITKVALGATYVGYAQCVVAIARTGAELYAPTINVDLDNSEWYPVVSNIMDGLGLAGAAIGGAGMMKTVLVLKKTSGKSMLTILKGLSRQERKRLTEELLQSTNQSLSRGKIKDLVALKVKGFPKRFATKAINVGIREQLLNAVGAVGGFAGSATSGLVSQAPWGSSDENYLVGLVNAYEVE